MQRHATRIVGAALSAVLMMSGLAGAQVQPGDKINTANADKVKDIVSPAMYWLVQHGWPMTIAETKKITLRKAFIEATEKYSSQVKLSADGLKLDGYVAGRPFPIIDTKDPQVAMKIMQNFRMALSFDDLDLRNFDADTGPISIERPLQVERHFLIDHFRRLRYIGRLYVDPKPEIPNSEGYEYKETLHPLIEPFDLKGVGFTYYRYVDPAKQDDSWLYLPSLRRVRRLSTAQRSDALFGQDTDQDSYGGYAGALAWMDWKFLGEKKVLGAFHSDNFPVKWASRRRRLRVRRQVGDARRLRRRGHLQAPAVRLLEARPLHRQGRLRGAVQRHVRPRRRALEDLGQQLLVRGRRRFPAPRMKYDEETPFPSAAVMVDIQLEHATKAALPSHRFPGEPGWYWHQGDKEGTTEDQFTIAELIGSGH